MLFKKKYNYFLILIFISSLFSIMNMQYNLVNYDKNIILEDNKTIHRMIKNDNLRYFSHGDEIKNKLKNNVNYFETGRNNFTKYLYPRLIALYYLIFDYDLYENNEN